MNGIKLPQTWANILASLSLAWIALVNLGGVPSNAWTHGISLFATFVQFFLLNMGYNRTPSGNLIPEFIKNRVDNTADQKAISEKLNG